MGHYVELPRGHSPGQENGVQGMKYVCMDPESAWKEIEDFTLGDYYEAMNLDVRTLGLDINKPAAEMSPMHALSLVNKWNRDAQGTYVYYLEADPAWL